MRATHIPMPIILFSLVASCSLDYSQVTVTDEMSEQIPDSVLHDFTYTVVEDGSQVYRIEAKRAEFYDADHRTLVEELGFREYDASGALVTEGSAGITRFDTETESAELEGDLRFYSATEEATIETDYLSWDSEQKLLTGLPESRVRIAEDSGSRLEGTGFEADVRRRAVDFAGRVSGRYVTGTDGE